MKLEEFRAIIRRIPRGNVMTYGEVAAAAGHPGAARQVVWSLRDCGPEVPWHRVLGAGGRILLPGEKGLEQRIRLEAEGVEFTGGRVKLAQKLEKKLEKKLQTKLKAPRASGR